VRMQSFEVIEKLVRKELLINHGQH